MKQRLSQNYIADPQNWETANVVKSLSIGVICQAEIDNKLLETTVSPRREFLLPRRD